MEETIKITCEAERRDWVVFWCCGEVKNDNNMNAVDILQLIY